LETVYEQIKDIIEMPNKKSKAYILDIFSFIEFTMNMISCILNRKISEEAFDITFVIEFTLFLRDIAKMLFVSKERKLISKTDIDIALEVDFKK
jgi:F0F1-type ATP synthase membrane subunit a